MAKIIDINTGREKTLVPAPNYAIRREKCKERAKETGTYCDCTTCKAKDDIAASILVTSYELCNKLAEDTGEPMYVSDWYEVMVLAMLTLKAYVYPNK